MSITSTNKQPNKQEKDEFQIFLAGKIPINYQLQLQGVKHAQYYTAINLHLQQCKLYQTTAIKLNCLCQISIIYVTARDIRA